MSRSAALWVALASAVALGCDTERFEHREDQTERYDASGLERVELRLDAGTIRITAATGPEVEARIDKRARAANRGDAEAAVDRLEVRSTRTGATLRIEARSQTAAPGGATRRARTDFDLVVPPSVPAVDVRTRDGSIVIEDLAAELRAETGDGRIRASRVSGRVTLRSEDGSITVRAAAGTLHASTADGRIEIDGSLEGLDAATDDGNIRFECLVSPRTPMSLRTLDGSIRLTLGDGVSARLDASAAEGRIEHALEGFRGTSRRSRLYGELRSGGESILLSTLDGNIRIESR